MTRFKIEYLVRGVLLTLVAIGAAFLLSRSSLYLNLSRWVDDAQHRLLGPTLSMRDVVVVDIDEESIEVLKPQYGAWPYSRDLYARVIPDLTMRGVKSIAFDILLAEGREGDDRFMTVLNESVVLAAASFPRPPLRSQQYQQQLAAVSLNGEGSGPNIAASKVPASKWPDVTLPLATFTTAGKARVGVISVYPDDDGTLRRVPLFHETHGRLLPSFPLATWLDANALRQAVYFRHSIRLGGREFAVDADGQIAPRFPSRTTHLTVVPFHHLLAGVPVFASNIDWRGKTVIIGSSSILFGDYTQTPTGRMSGLVLSAVIRQSLAVGNALKPAAPWVKLTLVIFALSPSLLWMLRRDAFSFVGFGIALAATLVMTVPIGMALFRTGVYVPWLFALTTGGLALTFAAGNGIARMRTERERLSYERLAAQEASRMKGEFLAHMAHELRTPLTAIMGFNRINSFNDKLSREQRRQNNEIIARNGEYLLKLINDNLDLATIDAGQMRLAPAPHAVEELVNEVTGSLAPLLADKSLTLSTQFERPLPGRVMIDAVRVKQILINLIGNAIKYTPSGRVDVSVRWREDILDISVADTGPGMDEETTSRLFEPYQKSREGGARKEGSTGLGLSIARRLARLMGGDLSVTSWPGQGSRFRVQIPAASVSSEEVDPAMAMSELPGAIVGRVLLAEDDEDIRALMRRDLEGLGLAVHAVENGLQAVRAVESGGYDVVLMDIEMPVMNGLEAVQVLRASGLTVPILALTAHTQGAPVDEARALGFDIVLSKPISQQHLANELSRLLRRAVPASKFASLSERV